MNENKVLITDATGWCQPHSYHDRCEFMLVCNYGEPSCRNLLLGTNYTLLNLGPTPVVYKCDEYLVFGDSRKWTSRYVYDICSEIMACEPPMKAVAYLRVSGGSQLDGDGFDRQLDAVTAYAGAHGIAFAPSEFAL